MASEGGDRSATTLAQQWQEQRPDLDLTAFRLVAAVMQLAQVLEAEFRALAQAKFGIGSGDMRILLALRRTKAPHAMRPTDLFQALLVSSGAVTKQVDRLISMGYVERVQAQSGSRRQLIALTARGIAAADFAQDAIATSLAGIAPTLRSMDGDEVATTQRCLEEVLAVASVSQAMRSFEDGGDE